MVTDLGLLIYGDIFFVVIDLRIFIVGCKEEFFFLSPQVQKNLSQVGASILFILPDMEKVNAT